MRVAKGDSWVEAWAAGVRHLLGCEHFEDYNLAMVAPSATAEGKRDSAIRESVDALLQENGKFSLREVAETIFPAGEWCRHGARGVYEDYPDQCYPILKTRWGTYAHRLVRRPNGKGGEENPLKQCIDKMRGELASSGPKRACYELPLYDPLTDAKTRMGGPCLMHVSLKVTRSREVNLTAVYRSQYYVERALGNMWGLALLQNFVAEEVGLPSGELVCLSTFAKLDPVGGRRRMRQIVDLSEATT